MRVRAVTVNVKPEFVSQFEEATADNHRGSIQEPGVVRFDVLRDDRTPGTYLLYEMYRDSQAIQAHKETDHYKRWRDTVAPMMAQPRQGVDLTLLHPEE